MKIIKDNLIIIILVIITLILTILNIVLLNKKVTCKKEVKTDNYTITYKNIIGFKSKNMNIEVTSDNKEILKLEKIEIQKDNFKIDNEDTKILASKKIKIKNRKNEILKYKKDGFKCN